MLTEVLLIASVIILDPMDMTEYTMYPSGVKECDKYPRYPYPESKMALLSLPREIIADDGKVIKTGHYLASLSVSKEQILIFEGHEIIYTLKVSEISIPIRNYKLSKAEFYTDNNGESFIILMQGKYKVLSKVKLSK